MDKLKNLILEYSVVLQVLGYDFISEDTRKKLKEIEEGLRKELGKLMLGDGRE